jgi:peptidoglycan/xylan/chitin deacetylase (PgdA/CDA1 family)
MYVTPWNFERHIRFLKTHFSVVRFSEIFERIKSGKLISHPNHKPFCVLTFDDGWYDFYLHAFPTLKAHELPAMVFLPTDYIGTRTWFWTDRLGYLFYHGYNSEASGDAVYKGRDPLVKKLIGLRGGLESRIESAIELLKGVSSESIEGTIQELSSIWRISPNPDGQAFLSWDEVREMAASNLITFGSHTAGHRILTTLTDDEIHDEIDESRKRLIAEQAVDPSFIPFCYPNGNYNDKIVSVVQNIGYNLAVTTKRGWNELGSAPFTLRRIGIHQDMTSTEAMFGCRILEVF